MPASFDLAAVQSAITTTRFSGLVQHFSSTASTSTLALEAAQDGAECGVWVADEQTAGRGRGGHTWHSVPGDGLYTSILIRPALVPERALWLSLATGLATQAAIRDLTGLEADIRWPNDLLLHGRKCGGILVETSVASQSESAASLRYAVIGIGINVNHLDFPAELSLLATSLLRETGKQWARGDLLAAILRALDLEIHLLETATDNLLERFSQASSWVRGKRVQVGEEGGYTGRTGGLNSEGFLIVEGDDGRRHTVLSGSVRALQARD
jgi:BirA family biotin operon repressor/biotin-[acetyl-CoA-carboxylase] ligase